MNKRFWICIPVVLIAVLAACGTPGVTPQNNDNGNNDGNTDTTAPTLTSSNPANAASSVAINSGIQLVFSEKMDTASVIVTADPNSDLGEASWNAEANTVSFDPPANLETSSAYTLSISGKDFAGNALAATSVEFTTAGDSNPPPPVDTTAPRIASSSPANDASGIAINSNIAVTFSEAMDPSSVALSITPNVNLGSVSFRSGNASVEFNPPTDFSGDTTYAVNVSGKDVAGNALTGSSSFKFKTAITTVPDTTAPGIPQNVVAEAGDAQIKLTWNSNTEPDLKGYTIYYSNNASNLNFSVFVAKPGTSKTLTGLTNGQIYFYQLEAEDGAGNRSGRTITKNSSPKDVTKPRLLSSFPRNGDSNVPFNNKAVFNFSKPMDTVKIVVGIICDTVPGDANSVCGQTESTVWSDGDKKLTLTFKAPNYMGVGVNMTYTLEAPFAVDKTGNPLDRTEIKFSTAKKNVTGDSIPPQMVSSTPANGDVGVAPTTKLVFNFSEPMDTVKSKPSRSCASLPNHFDGVCGILDSAIWENNDTRLTLTYLAAAGNLGNAVELTIKFETATDKAGNPLPNTQVKFSVADTISPQLRSFSPEINAVGVDPLATIKLNFSEPMDRASVQSRFSTGLNGTIAWSGNDTVMEFRGNPSLPSGVQVNWQLSAGATDKSNNPINAASAGTFRVLTRTTVTLPALASGHFLIACSNADFGNLGVDCGYIKYLNETVMRVGDRSRAGGSRPYEASHGVLMFSPAPTRPANSTLVSARLYVPFTTLNGNPFSTLGTLVIEPCCEADPIQTTSQAGLGHIFRNFAFNSEATRIRLPNTTRIINQDVTAVSITGFMLRFLTDYSNNNTGDYLDFGKNATLTITWESP
jgi:methionine-rich copper-binding protein CopC